MLAETRCNSIRIETFFDSILDVISDGIYISDWTGKTLFVNSAYEKLTGLKSEELIGKSVTELKQEGKFDVILNPEIVKTGKPTTSVQTTKVGRKVVLNGYPVLDKYGNVALVVTFVRDVTLLTQLKEQLAYQQELIDRYNHHGDGRYIAHESIPSSSLVFISDKMHKLINTGNLIARTDATVLLLGETGVGKDVMARKIHEGSQRSIYPFFKVDCTSIPPNLVESELFGYEAGAFSGANNKGKPGYIELANHGTLFLDEIGELPLAIQGKLLRVLQDQEIMRIGSTKVKKVDVRIIAATNRDLEQAVREGTFRSDLFYRLKVAVLKIPPLRERKEDILPLTHYFLDKFCSKYKKKISISKEAELLFVNYGWPGNVRELENLIQSLVVSRESKTIEATELPHNMLHAKNDDSLLLSVGVNYKNRSLSEIMFEIEKELLQRALQIHGSISKVAQILKVDRTTVFRKVKKYSLI